jgi:hypothetical protein
MGYKLDRDKLQTRKTGLGVVTTFNDYQIWSNEIVKLSIDKSTSFLPKTIGPKELVRWLDEVQG